MKKILAALATSSIVMATFVPAGGVAWAVSSPSSFTVDCTDADALNDATLITGSVNRVVSGVNTDTFTITNSGSGACTVTMADANVLTGAAGESSVTIAGGGSASATFIIKTQSGGYTITPAVGSAVFFGIDNNDCSLAGAGIESAPFLVGVAADFQTIGEGSCGLDAHYLQTAHLTLSDFALDQVGLSAPGSAPFTGTYDGAHYTISLTGTNNAGWSQPTASRSGGSFTGNPMALFPYVTGGTIKRVYVSGAITNGLVNNFPETGSIDWLVMGGVVGVLSSGGVVSEVHSAVTIELIAASNPAVSSSRRLAVGGIVGWMEVPTGGNPVRIQYSKSSAEISWDPFQDGSMVTPGVAYLGGIAGLVTGDQSSAWSSGSYTGTVREIRDSYSTAALEFDSQLSTANVYMGGILGGENDRAGLLVRTYSVATATDLCVSNCVDASDAKWRTGSLVGTSDGNDGMVGNFFQASGVLFDAGVGSGSQPLDYTVGGLPVAVPLASALLKTKSTYQSRESATTSGVPDGVADLSTSVNTAILDESDYLWAIEAINVQTFVPSDYQTLASFVTRDVFADTSVSKEYIVKSSGALRSVAAHTGSDAATASGYPALGRVWDICDNYPTLVWEERTSCTGSSGGSSGSSDSSSSSSSSASSNPGGLSDADYAAFLASGLTLEQFLAARLAATGPDGALLVGGGSLTLLFLVSGVFILVALSRERRLRRS